METFRPPFPAGAPPHQLCPLCRAPHFPFCSPHQAPAGHRPHQRFEGLYSGQQAPQPCPGAFNLHAGPIRRPPHSLPEPHVPSERPFDFPFHQSHFPQGNSPHFVDDRRDRVSFGQVQTSVPRFSVSDQQNHGSLHVDPGLGARNAWIDPERDFAYRHTRMCAQMGENVGPRERFMPSSHNPELPRLEGRAYMQENRIGRGPRDEIYVTPEVASVERSMAKQNHAVDSHTGAIQGRSRYETCNDALMDHANGSNHPVAHDVIQGSCDSHGNNLFDAHRQQMTAKVYNKSGDEEERYQSIGMQRREEAALADQNMLTQQGLKREDGLPLQNAFRLEPYEHREEAQVRNTGHSQVNRGLKRKHGEQALSREEELLIEKGLLDDESSGPQSHESFTPQAHYEIEQFMPRYKQGAPFQQLTYPSSATFPERETMSTRFGEPDEHNLNDMLSVRSENLRNKREEVEMGRGIPKFAGDWPLQSFIPGKPPMDATVDGRNHSQPVAQIPHFDGAQTKKDILHRQYLEWESEEKHMEALRRAERLAKEIQQRDDKGMYQSGSLKPEDSRNWEFVQDNTQKAYQQNQKNYRAERVECTAEHKGMQHACQSLGVSMQNPQESLRLDCDIERNFHTAHCESQPWQRPSRDGIGQDIQFVEAHVGMQKTRQDGKVQLSARFPHQAQRPKEQTPHQPQAGLQSVSRHDQPLSSLRSAYPLHQKSAVEELSQEKPDMAPSYSFHNQFRSDAAHELPDSFQPLPIAASVKPPPPDSPPPPLPPSLPPLYDGQPPPLAAGTFLSDSWSFLQGTADRPQQCLPFDIQGPQKSHVLAHSGVSQSQAHNPPHFQPQMPQSTEKSKIVDAVNIFRNPGRLTRPDRFVVIFRGLPGSGKSYFAKALRDVEVMNGGSAPRIHSMDDYFTCEVEKEEEIEIGSSRSKKKIVKRVMEYCYEPDMEEAYRASMLKAFKKTLEEGMFKFVIVDDRNVLIADFAQFWAIAKRSGYEAFILEAPYTDVKGCGARNVHNFTEAQISSMSECWEATPLLYLKMDVSSLFRADDLNAQDIIEVDMDADDMERDLEDEEEENNQSAQDHFPLLASERPVSGERWQVAAADAEKKTAQSSKSRRPPVDVGTGTRSPTENADNALSGLMTTYGKKDKFVHWSDNRGVKGRPVGFSIGSFHKMASLIIGPGPGYNGTSNLLVLEDDSGSENPGTRKNNKFVEQLRAEQEAFKAVFARRRQRILGMDDEDDD